MHVCARAWCHRLQRVRALSLVLLCVRAWCHCLRRVRAACVESMTTCLVPLCVSACVCAHVRVDDVLSQRQCVVYTGVRVRGSYVREGEG